MEQAYLLCLMLISAFAAAALYSIWQQILLHSPVKGKKDYGLAYLAGAMGVWVLVGLWGLLSELVPPLISEMVFSLLSTTNSLFYLLAIQHFDYTPETMRHRRWQPIVLSLAGLTAAATVLISSFCFQNHISEDVSKGWVNIPDVMFSFPTTIALSLAFWRSFYYRGYKFLAWLSVAAMTIVLLVQLPDASLWLKEHFGETEKWLTISAYALVMMLCFALAATWGIEEFALPHPSHLHLNFEGKVHHHWSVQIKIRDQRATAWLSAMNYKNLLLFTLQRMESPENGWVHLDEDLSGYNYFRRILIDLARALQELMPDKADNELLEMARRMFFEYQAPGAYRLKIEPSNFEFGDKFFTHESDLVRAMQSTGQKKKVEDVFNRIREKLKPKA